MATICFSHSKPSTRPFRRARTSPAQLGESLGGQMPALTDPQNFPDDNRLC